MDERLACNLIALQINTIFLKCAILHENIYNFQKLELKYKFASKTIK